MVQSFTLRQVSETKRNEEEKEKGKEWQSGPQPEHFT